MEAIATVRHRALDRLIVLLLSGSSLAFVASLVTGGTPFARVTTLVAVVVSLLMMVAHRNQRTRLASRLAVGFLALVAFAAALAGPMGVGAALIGGLCFMAATVLLENRGLMQIGIGGALVLVLALGYRTIAGTGDAISPLGAVLCGTFVVAMAVWVTRLKDMASEDVAHAAMHRETHRRLEAEARLRLRLPVRDAASDLEDGVSQIAGRVDDLSRELSRVAGGCEASASLMVEVTEGLDQKTVAMLRGVHEIRDQLRALRLGADAIRRDAETVLSKAKIVREDTDKTVACMDVLAVHATSIEGLLRQIRSVADLSRSLSLNATLQAERAGDDGRAFRVVAGQIGELTNEVLVAVERLHRRTGGLRYATQRAVASARRGATAATKTAEEAQAIEAIIQSQLNTANEAADAVDRLAALAERGATAGREARRTGEQLLAQANDVDAAVSRLRVVTRAGGSASGTPIPP